mmetsp:Transcript_12630/g.27337  ORF Transcript_12630/g.27337 Transcript_12630/m.27337 type:complete len:235 (-) Transcript_12630:292-996(-)
MLTPNIQYHILRYWQYPHVYPAAGATTAAAAAAAAVALLRTFMYRRSVLTIVITVTPTCPYSRCPTKDVMAGIMRRKALLVKRLPRHIRRHQTPIKYNSALVLEPSLSDLLAVFVTIVVAIAQVAINTSIQPLERNSLNLPLIKRRLGFMQHVNFSIASMQQIIGSPTDKVANKLLIEFHGIILPVLSRRYRRAWKVPYNPMKFLCLLLSLYYGFWQCLNKPRCIDIIAYRGTK